MIAPKSSSFQEDDDLPGEPLPYAVPLQLSEGSTSHGSADLEEIVGTGVANTPVDPVADSGVASELPADWPNPEGFIPAKPMPTRPPLVVQYEPIISHMKAYNGNDEDFTQALGEYFYFRDDARFGGWQAYLQRSEDFIRFCCHLHVRETLAARGGQLESELILRWPIGRYER
jgi:hypothetical protein